MESESTPLTTLRKAKEIDIPFPLVPEAARDMLTEKEAFDYEQNRKEFARWLLIEGKDPEEIKGYSTETAKRTMYRVGYFERFVWDSEDEYVPFPTPQHAHDYIEALAYSDYTNSHKHVSRRACVSRTARSPTYATSTRWHGTSAQNGVSVSDYSRSLGPSMGSGRSVLTRILQMACRRL